MRSFRIAADFSGRQAGAHEGIVPVFELHEYSQALGQALGG
ncbi:MAG: hypothetical protein ACPHJZ_04485 [Limisphaerales bacterium]